MPTSTKDLASLLNASSKVSINEFLQLTKNVIEVMQSEKGYGENLKITGRLVEASPEGEAIFIGDLHGDLDSLTQILRASDFLCKAQSGKPTLLIFLGDYGDRGVYSVEVYYVVLRLKESFPNNVVLMRGNHEGPDDLLASPHDLPFYLQNRFGEGWTDAYLKLKELFNHLYTAVIVRDRCVVLHGGVPSQAKSLDDIAYAHLKHPNESHLEEILWSDPEENLEGTYPSPRGAGKLFGEDVTARFLDLLRVKFLIRGHEPADEGFKINHSGRILTLFSRRGEPYFNSKGAFLQLDLSSQFEDVFQLQRFVRQL